MPRLNEDGAPVDFGDRGRSKFKGVTVTDLSYQVAATETSALADQARTRRRNVRGRLRDPLRFCVRTEFRTRSGFGFHTRLSTVTAGGLPTSQEVSPSWMTVPAPSEIGQWEIWGFPAVRQEHPHRGAAL